MPLRRLVTDCRPVARRAVALLVTVTLGILTKEVPFSFFQQFGFQSGADTDKLADFPYVDRCGRGIVYPNRYINAMFSCNVLESYDQGSHRMFIAEIEIEPGFNLAGHSENGFVGIAIELGELSIQPDIRTPEMGPENTVFMTASRARKTAWSTILCRATTETGSR